MILVSETFVSTKPIFFKFITIGLLFGLMGVESGPVAVYSDASAQTRPTGCEYNTSVLDSLAQKTELHELIIVIAHLGPKDTKPNLNNRRLHNVRTYLTEFLTDSSVRRRPETLVLAQGERVQHFGAIYFYVNGKLVDTLKIRANADLSVANCGWEPPETACPNSMRNFFPCKDRYRK